MRNSPLQRRRTSEAKWKHGRCDSPEYRSWCGMKHRCLNPDSEQYNYYGGRGIMVCARWLEFANFYADMGPRPGPGYSIDRIDNDGNYEPFNCKWATRTEQMKNRRSNIRITFQGDTMILTDWERRLGLPHGVLHHRYDDGWSVEAMLTTPLKAELRLTLGDESLTVKEWSARTGIDQRRIRRRLEQGWSVKDTLTQPIRPGVSLRQRG